MLSGGGQGDVPKETGVSKFRSFASKNFFLVGMFVAVSLAKALPELGKNGGVLRPELFIGKYGVTLIFLLSGLSLEASQLSSAIQNYQLNGWIQASSFLIWPLLIGWPLTRILPLPQPLLDGLLILTCLPTTVNMCVILTSAAGGNVATALCNAVLSNMAGIFVTPFLLFRFFATDIQLPFFSMVTKLSQKVLLPVTVGQLLRATPAKSFYSAHSKLFKRLQEVVLLSILWNAFCTALASSTNVLELRHGLALAVLLPAVHAVALAGLAFATPRVLQSACRRDVVACMFCGSQKTLAFGLPLIQTIFSNSLNLAAYCAPLMLMHPIQLVVGSLLIPRLERYTAAGDNA